MNPILLGVYGLTHFYGKRQVLDEVSFELPHGEILALLGPNGSGKSTLMKAVAGILAPTSGLVKHLSRDFFSMLPDARARTIAYVAPDLRAEFPLTAFETVMLGRICQSSKGLRRLTVEDERAVQAAMERCHCWEFREQDLHTLSGGERQLVALARAIAQGARLLFLDEALSRMDLNHQAVIGRLLKQLASEAYGILLVSHDLNLASEWATSALLLKDGRKIAHGPIREVLTEQSVRKLYPGTNLVVGQNPATGTPKVFFGKL
jgi:iron complex transport system ATP-binding protein